MRPRLIRMKIDKIRQTFKRGTPSMVDQAIVEDWHCPTCGKPTRKAKCLVSHIQYGFEFDDHIDYFECRCGQHYYCNYRIWLVERETS
jgi:hypothetical protein